jgi:hypothetical protein
MGPRSTSTKGEFDAGIPVAEGRQSRVALGKRADRLGHGDLRTH